MFRWKFYFYYSINKIIFIATYFLVFAGNFIFEILKIKFYILIPKSNTTLWSLSTGCSRAKHEYSKRFCKIENSENDSCSYCRTFIFCEPVAHILSTR